MAVWLCIGNSQRAIARGKSGKKAIAYTLALWFGPEIIVGTILALLVGLNVVTYIIALLFAVVGGVISAYISIRGVRQIASLPKAVKLSSPCTVRIYRDHSDIEQKQPRYFSLNNDYIGSLDDDTMIKVSTSRSQNLLTSRSAYEASNETSYTFEAHSGNEIEIHIMGGEFQGDKTKVFEHDGKPQQICQTRHS